jgi:HEPN domain-containing protein
MTNRLKAILSKPPGERYHFHQLLLLALYHDAQDLIRESPKQSVSKQELQALLAQYHDAEYNLSRQAAREVMKPNA